MKNADALAAASHALASYADAVDARDAGRIGAMLTDDVRLTRGDVTVEGREAFIEAYRPFLESEALGSRHVVANLAVEQVEESSLSVTSRFEATMFLSDVTRRVTGRYVDDLVLHDGRWLFAHKRNIMEWSVDLPPATRL